jgi:hypothetical protein
MSHNTKNLPCTLDAATKEGLTGHIRRWEKSHGAPLVWGPHTIMIFFLNLVRETVRESSSGGKSDKK